MQKVKAGVHCAQAVLIFLAGCLSLAVLTKSGGTSGTTGYYFGLVRICNRESAMINGKG